MPYGNTIVRFLARSRATVFATPDSSRRFQAHSRDRLQTKCDRCLCSRRCWCSARSLCLWSPRRRPAGVKRRSARRSARCTRTRRRRTRLRRLASSCPLRKSSANGQCASREPAPVCAALFLVLLLRFRLIALFARYRSPPGTLLLNMLIKNERDHLKRTLPKWAKIIGKPDSQSACCLLHPLNATHSIQCLSCSLVFARADYWIVGVDDNNTDDSEEIIRKELGHIPGEIVIVGRKRSLCCVFLVHRNLSRQIDVLQILACGFFVLLSVCWLVFLILALGALLACICNALTMSQVKFDGMGPTWSILVQAGLEKFPQATHGA